MNKVMQTKYIFLLIVWLIGMTGFAIPPSAFHKALSKLYPSVTEAAWSQQGYFYVASFTQDGFGKKVWMNPNAKWVMTTTDLQTADQLPPEVYNAFAFGNYSQWTVTDVDLVEFPKRPSQYVVTVNLDNSISTYMLYYSPNGQLTYVRNISYTGGGITP